MFSQLLSLAIATATIEVSPNLNPEPQQIAQAGCSSSTLASWYGPGFHGRLTANGQRYNQNALTAAHRSLPFGTVVRVTNLSNNRSVNVIINDRGPYISGRGIDLSRAAFNQIADLGTGVVRVSLSC